MSIRDAIERYYSFDHMGSPTERFSTIGVNAAPTISTTNPRTGPRCLAVGGSGGSLTSFVRTLNLPARTGRYIGFGCFPTQFGGDSGSGGQRLAAFVSAGTVHMALGVTSLGRLTAFFGDGTVPVATSTRQLALDQWWWIEVWCSVADSGGRFVVRVNRTAVGWIDYTGDTRNGGAATQDELFLGNHRNNTTAWGARYDDVYILNGDHADADWLGDARVTYYPADAEGDQNDGTPSAGSDNSDVVDEVPPNDDADYVTLAAASDIERYTLGTVSGLGTIFGVAPVYRARKTDAGACDLRSGFKAADTTVTTQTTEPQSTTYQTFGEHMPDVPGGTGWVDSDLTNGQLQVERVT